MGFIKNGIYKENNFVFVGRLSPEKNIRTLIEAFNEVKRNNSRAQNWGLVVVGDGPQKEELKTLVSAKRYQQTKARLI